MVKSLFSTNYFSSQILFQIMMGKILSVSLWGWEGSPLSRSSLIFGMTLEIIMLTIIARWQHNHTSWKLYRMTRMIALGKGRRLTVHSKGDDDVAVPKVKCNEEDLLTEDVPKEYVT